jgi:hypothetical protein
MRVPTVVHSALGGDALVGGAAAVGAVAAGAVPAGAMAALAGAVPAGAVAALARGAVAAGALSADGGNMLGKQARAAHVSRAARRHCTSWAVTLWEAQAALCFATAAAR